MMRQPTPIPARRDRCGGLFRFIRIAAAALLIIALTVIAIGPIAAQQHERTQAPDSERGRTGAEGHAHQHRFADAEQWARRFEDPARDAWQQPDRVIEMLRLRPDHIIADIGSATGYFPVRIAPRIPQGRIWGVDIEPDMVRYLNRRARREHHANLFSILATADDPLLPEPVDAVLMVNTYHHVRDRAAYFRRLREHLRPGARIAIVDFKKGDLPVGPSDEMKVGPDQVRHTFEAAGYTLAEADTDSLPYQYILVFRPTTPPEAPSPKHQ